MRDVIGLAAPRLSLFVLTGLLAGLAFAQPPVRLPAKAEVHFDQKLQDWDGFGVNYVEVVNVRDLAEYKEHPQEYGGFSTLSEQKRQEVLDMVFGSDGLKPGLVKMFQDSLQEGMTEASKGKFDHETTTKWMRYFVAEGLKKTRARGADLQIISTMYGPPGWTTKQKIVRGRDLDPTKKEDVARYMIHWVKWLRDHEKLPVKYVSLFNEGEGWNRWPPDGSTGGDLTHDYNMWWPNNQIIDFLHFMRPMMDQAGLQDVGLTPGETSNWEAFGRWYAPYYWADPVALKNIGLITSHGFGLGRGATNSLGVDTLRNLRPELHAWNTSMTFIPHLWAKGGADTLGDNIFIEQIRQNIYDAKVNGIIPWSVVQSDPWTGQPNAAANPYWNEWVGTGFWVDRKGGYSIDPGYYYYKHVSRAGQPGMAVASATSQDSEVGVIAFGRAGTQNSDALIVNNLGHVRSVAVKISGTNSQSFEAFLTDPATKKYYEPMGSVTLHDGVLECSMPSQSVITFFAK